MFVVALLLDSSAVAQTFRNNDYQTGSAVDRLIGSEPTSLRNAGLRQDRQVVPTAYDQSPPARVMPSEAFNGGDANEIPGYSKVPQRQRDSEMPNFIEREKEADSTADATSETPAKKQHFGQLIATMGMNLAFVLMVGIGFIVFAKQWIKPQGTNKKETTNERSSSLKIKEELVLDDNSTIRVIDWKGSEVLVASDANGVKSMIAVAPNFAETLDQIASDTEPREIEAPPQRSDRPKKKRTPTVSQTQETDHGAVDDRLIQMLLDSANRSAAASKTYSAKDRA
ncbi:hypothetical protein [Mariniblastus fucicola]|uniref:Flagellar biosynthesis protein, FliO n=1 Tax=Mariniblastus fucicola TaxID=980251 RepID=A0A5B9PL32_9BACT|nr:hypothetical protein [Mariniblastus fucicola]QEG23391.1 hypothetical protein MFFC18_32890 [Mariniblastus fucicola]